MEIFEFDGVIKQSDNGVGAYVLFPYDMETSFGKKNQVKMQCEFDGIHYRGSIVNMGVGPCIGMLKAIREKLGKEIGDTVHIRIWKDEEERVVEVPAELQVLFDQRPELKAFFGKLSYTNQKDYVVWITSAKQEKTKQDRLIKTMELLANGVKSRTQGK